VSTVVCIASVLTIQYSYVKRYHIIHFAHMMCIFSKSIIYIVGVDLIHTLMYKES